jgi:hypothetical protein
VQLNLTSHKIKEQSKGYYLQSSVTGMSATQLTTFDVTWYMANVSLTVTQI